MKVLKIRKGGLNIGINRIMTFPHGLVAKNGVLDQLSEVSYTQDYHTCIIDDSKISKSLKAHVKWVVPILD